MPKPMSTQPSRTADTASVGGISISSTSTSGRAFFSDCSAGGRKAWLMYWSCPTLMVFPRSPPTRRAESSARSICSSAAAVSSLNARPAGVSETVRRSRSNSRTPSSASSFATCCESAGWVTPRRSAALRKCRSSATAWKDFKYLSSMAEGLITAMNHSRIKGNHNSRPP